MSNPYGKRIRQARVARALSLDTVAEMAGMSKSYLSLIETGRLANPPIDKKLQRLEEILGFAKGDLLREAQLARTPADIRAVLSTLAGGDSQSRDGGDGNARPGRNLDNAYLSGLLQKAVEARTANVEPVRLARVPIINHVSAGNPADFADLSHPAAEADAYVGFPAGQHGPADPATFAARVSGDSMAPKYTAGDIVVFSPAAQVRDGDDCYVRLSDGLTTFKRVYAETAADGTATIRLQPRNPKYDVRVVPADEVTGVYRAMYRYESLD